MKLCKDCKHCMTVSYHERALLMGLPFNDQVAAAVEDDRFFLCVRDIDVTTSPVDGDTETKGKFRDCRNERNPLHPFGRFCGKEGKYWEASDENQDKRT